MTEDIFARKNRIERERKIREESKAHQDAITEQSRRNVRDAEKKKTLDPNRDIGYPWQRKFFEFGCGNG